MIADVLMNLFDAGLTVDSTDIDPFAAQEETVQEPDSFDVFVQEQPGGVESGLHVVSPAKADFDFVNGDPGAIDNAEGDGVFHDSTDATDVFSIDDPTHTIGDNLGESLFDPIFDFVSDIWDLFFQPFFDPDDIVRSADFSFDGSMDTKNNLVVVGDVASDINFISEQTHGSCSLMAQEQFVHRLTGKPIPEEYLEWQAEKWGVYHPDLGTSWEGQEMILDHFNIPYDRDYFPDMDDIVRSMSKGNDVLIGVDAREFYQDPSIPPGSGHAVALVGRGIDPETGDLKGFYVTDSNYPMAAHFIPAERLEASLIGLDMISVPEKLTA